MTYPPLGAAGEPLGPAAVARYSRHLLLPEVGFEGQARLAASRVAVVGAGGLGSATVTYLAAAGVGTLGIIDDDRVEASNLQRQVIHGESDVGRLKTESAEESVARINPGVNVIRHDVRLEAANALEILGGYDLVVDGADNFPTRYLVNDACVRLGIPDVWGSIFRFDGQVSVWWAAHGPCYRCMFPDPPPPGSVPSCAEGGVLGALCGVVGSAQAAEAVKLLLGAGEPLVGRLLVHDALAGSFDTLQIRRNPDCPVCSAHATLTELVDDPWACMAPLASGALAAPGVVVPEIDASGLARWLASDRPPLLVDVRGRAERAIAAIPGDVAVELERFRDGSAYADLGPADEPIVLYCKSGARSAEAATLALAAGFTDVANLAGGVLAWARDVDPTLVRY